MTTVERLPLHVPNTENDSCHRAALPANQIRDISRGEGTSPNDVTEDSDTDEILRMLEVANLKSLLTEEIIFRPAMRTIYEDKEKELNILEKEGLLIRLDARTAVSRGARQSKLAPVPPTPISPLFDPSGLIMNWTRPRRIGSGLYNIGNTCFMNSVLQCLTYTPPLGNYMFSKDHTNYCKLNGFCAMCQFQKHYTHSQQFSSCPIRPNAIVQFLSKIAPSFHLGRQEDSHEFLRYIIDAMQNSCLASLSSKILPEQKYTTVVHQIFGGQIRSQVTCCNCKTRSDTFEPMLDLSLNIKNCGSLVDALRRATLPDTLDGNNSYFCEKCKKKEPAQKILSIHGPPRILTIHLKRFSFGSQLGIKLQTKVAFPSSLNLRLYMTDKQGPPVQYSLYAVLIHAGLTCSSGHYFCYIIGPNGTWYKMNDTYVGSISLSMVLNSEAYMLFYKQEITSSPTKPNTLIIEGLGNSQPSPLARNTQHKIPFNSKNSFPPPSTSCPVFSPNPRTPVSTNRISFFQCLQESTPVTNTLQLLKDKNLNIISPTSKNRTDVASGEPTNQTLDKENIQSTNQTPNKENIQSTNQTPNKENIQSTNQTPNKENIQSTNQTPNKENIQSTNQTLNKENIQSTNQTPNKENIQSTNQTPNKENIQSTNQTPNKENIQSTNQTPASACIATALSQKNESINSYKAGTSKPVAVVTPKQPETPRTHSSISSTAVHKSNSFKSPSNQLKGTFQIPSFYRNKRKQELTPNLDTDTLFDRVTQARKGKPTFQSQLALDTDMELTPNKKRKVDRGEESPSKQRVNKVSPIPNNPNNNNNNINKQERQTNTNPLQIEIVKSTVKSDNSNHTKEPQINKSFSITGVKGVKPTGVITPLDNTSRDSKPELTPAMETSEDTSVSQNETTVSKLESKNTDKNKTRYRYKFIKKLYRCRGDTMDRYIAKALKKGVFLNAENIERELAEYAKNKNSKNSKVKRKTKKKRAPSEVGDSSNHLSVFDVTSSPEPTPTTKLLNRNSHKTKSSLHSTSTDTKPDSRHTRHSQQDTLAVNNVSQRQLNSDNSENVKSWNQGQESALNFMNCEEKELSDGGLDLELDRGKVRKKRRGHLSSRKSLSSQFQAEYDRTNC